MNEVFGRKLGQYVLLEQLGEGGMAKVYNAFDARVERNVAIKVILPSKRTSNVFLKQFEQEAKALANLTHTNIVKVLNYGVQDGQPYLVMEYIPGGTLKEALHQKLPWQTAAAILAPIARALDYVHQQQIVHRDVKPSNILLQDDFSPMLSDFGILKLLEGKAIDLVLSDVVMPGMSGVELARRMRDSHPDVPVLLATGYSDEIVKRGSEFEVLAKPFGAADHWGRVISNTRPANQKRSCAITRCSAASEPSALRPGNTETWTEYLCAGAS